MKDDDVDFGHVEHPEGNGRTQVHRDGQCGRLDVQLGANGESKGRLAGGTSMRSEAVVLLSAVEEDDTEESLQR